MASHLDRKQVDEIVLVGGSTRIPKVQQLIKVASGEGIWWDWEVGKHSLGLGDKRIAREMVYVDHLQLRQLS